MSNSMTADELRAFAARMSRRTLLGGAIASAVVAGSEVAASPVEEQPEKKAICLGLLSYDGKIHLRTAMCLMQAAAQCAAKGWGFSFILREADSMVARGRSYLASQFLTNEACAHCTDFVFVDTDLSWEGDEFINLCSHDVDVVGGSYPFKDDSGDFPLRWHPDGFDENMRLWRVDAVTPGFFRVTRKALEKMARLMPHLEFKDRGTAEGQKFYMFFDNAVRSTGVYDEGYTFCEKWRQLGGTVWLDPDTNITHIGQKAFNHGSQRQWLARKAETFEKLESEFPGIPPLVLMDKAMSSKNFEAAKAKVATVDVIKAA
jgi:hypothetical protein